MENSTARLALAHHTEVAKQRNATTFLWLYNKLIACFNCDTIYHDSTRRMTVEMLLGLIRRCCSLTSGSRLAMTHVALEPYNTFDDDADAIRCQPVLPPCGPDVHDAEHVKAGDYILYLKDSKGNNVYKPTNSVDQQLFSPFDRVKRVLSFAEKAWDRPPTEVRGELEAEALLLPHNQGLCVVTGTQGAGGRDPNGTTQVRWIYPPSMNVYDVSPTHSPELSSYENWEEEGKLEVPHNLIMMREDIYDLFQKHAFGIDLDASRHGEIYVFHSSEIVKKKILHSSLAVEVLDKMARAFIREHFQQCLMSGILGEDVEDQAEFSKNDIYLKLEKLPVGALPKATEWLQDEWWNTETGEALKEWLYYKEDKED